MENLFLILSHQYLVMT